MCSKTILEKSAFIGLLSLIEALLHAPMQSILNELNVDEEIIQTLVFSTGELGTILQLVCAVERFDTQSVDEILETLPLSREEFSAAVQEAYVLTEAFSAGVNS
jgi:EAL and modified HD-GYP domain-containing signal transduction protein